MLCALLPKCINIRNSLEKIRYSFLFLSTSLNSKMFSKYIYIYREREREINLTFVI